MVDELIVLGPEPGTRPVWAISKTNLEASLGRMALRNAVWLRDVRFAAEAGEVVLIPDSNGELGGAAFGLGAGIDPFVFGALSAKLPPGSWALEPVELAFDLDQALLAYLLGAYRFAAYRKPRKEWPRLVCPARANLEAVNALASAHNLVFDLINMPANDMGPAELEAAARKLAMESGAQIEVTEGASLQRDNFPLIFAVGQASARAPRLIDLTWGRSQSPKVTLVGKGVCFDTGGLDLKPSGAMALMKKDMGGAATVLGIAKAVMDAKLDLRLRVLIPAVENSVAGNAMRPGDVYSSRKGLNIEIGNTDAEGRLVLADALALADEEAPDLLIDLATLTGAARTALGPEIVPFYTADDRLAQRLADQAQAQCDPLWRMPLWERYAEGLESRIADLNNVADGAFAGSIVAALFLAKFVEHAKSYAHFDIYAWNPKPRPGHPHGAEVQTLRAIFGLLKSMSR